MADQANSSHFLRLPAEIREEIYRLILSPSASRVELTDEYTQYDYRPALGILQVNRQIHHESRKIFRDLNIFVRIETPWDMAEQYVQMDGHLPIIVSGAKAGDFTQYSLRVRINSPQVPMLQVDDQRFVVLLDDLDKFTRIWYYADLSHSQLNQHLRLSLILHDPYAADYEEPHVPKAVQRRMLLPFGMVKNVIETVIVGDVKPYAAIESELRKLQATPHASPESCLREATRCKAEGNAALAAGDLHRTLECYTQAWLAIHVVVAGRQRHVHGDRYFARILTEEPYVGKNGGTERLVIRVSLVANTCLVYLKLNNFEMCDFWGMRTINMLRSAAGLDEQRPVLQPQDEAMLQFPAADQMGKIYYRTALAKRELGDESEARRLLRVAAIYLPRDEQVKKAVAETALKLG